MPLRTTARITAFRPGQSPPPLRTPTRTASNILSLDGEAPTHDAGLEAPAAVIGRMPRALILIATSLAAAFLAGCGGEPEESRIPGHTLTLYSSLPLHGVSAPPLARSPRGRAWRSAMPV